MPEHWAPTQTRTSRKCSVISPQRGKVPARQCTPRSKMTKSTQHRNVPWAPRQESNTNSTQWSQSVQHPQCKMPCSTHNVRACRSPLSNVSALFCCEGEGVQTVCTLLVHCADLGTAKSFAGLHHCFQPVHGCCFACCCINTYVQSVSLCIPQSIGNL
jgi:hypothetical protein